MNKGFDVPEHDDPNHVSNRSVPLEKIVEEYNDDVFIHARLKELDSKCTEMANMNLGHDADYVIKLIRKIINEIGVMKLKIVSDRPRKGWYAYDGELLRNVASIVFKMELLAARYFAESYKRYTYISSADSCNSKDKVYELADEWLSDRRTMVDVVSSMLDEVQGLGITPNPVSPETPEAGNPLLDILADLLPGKKRV